MGNGSDALEKIELINGRLDLLEAKLEFVLDMLNGMEGTLDLLLGKEAEAVAGAVESFPLFDGPGTPNTDPLPSVTPLADESLGRQIGGPVIGAPRKTVRMKKSHE